MNKALRLYKKGRRILLTSTVPALCPRLARHSSLANRKRRKCFRFIGFHREISYLDSQHTIVDCRKLQKLVFRILRNGNVIIFCIFQRNPSSRISRGLKNASERFLSRNTCQSTRSTDPHISNHSFLMKLRVKNKIWRGLKWRKFKI